MSRTGRRSSLSPDNESLRHVCTVNKANAVTTSPCAMSSIMQRHIHHGDRRSTTFEMSRMLFKLIRDKSLADVFYLKDAFVSSSGAKERVGLRAGNVQGHGLSLTP